MEEWKLEPAKDLGLPPTERLKSLHRESGLISSGLHITWWAMVRGYLRVWHRLSITGSEHIPTKPPFVFVANHSSHLDALVLASLLSWRIRDRVFPIAAGDVFFQSPLSSVFSAGLLNALPMWRKNCGPRALAQLRTRLVEEPCSYILFPEGTRSRDGQMTEFKPGLGMLIAGTSVPVVPCYLHGCFEAWKPDQRWPRPKRIHVRMGEPISFEGTTNTREGWEQVVAMTQERVRAITPIP